MIKRKILVLVALWVLLGACNGQDVAVNESTALKIMTFNVQRSDLYGWNDPTWEYDKSRGEKAVDVILKADADIVGLQEYMHNNPDNELDPYWIKKNIEQKTGKKWHYSTAGTGVLSRYPIKETTKSGKGVIVMLPGSKEIVIYSNHIGLQPAWQHYYIPYSAELKSEGEFLYSEEEIIKRARLNWDTEDLTDPDLREFTEPMKLVKEVSRYIAEGASVVVMGDFNEVSHYDWTHKAADAGIVPRKIEAPFSKLLTEEIGMIDSYHQDRLNKGENEITRSGFTWTPYADKKNWQKDDDRIDFIYFAGKNINVVNSQVVGEDAGEGVDIGIEGKFPADHRAVVSTFSF